MNLNENVEGSPIKCYLIRMIFTAKNALTGKVYQYLVYKNIDYESVLSKLNMMKVKVFVKDRIINHCHVLTSHA